LLGFWRDGGGGVRAEELAVVLGKATERIERPRVGADDNRSAPPYYFRFPELLA
jgi:hypothetical protein